MTLDIPPPIVSVLVHVSEKFRLESPHRHILKPQQIIPLYFTSIVHEPANQGAVVKTAPETSPKSSYGY